MPRAGRGQIWRLVLAPGMRAALAGIAVGALGAAVLVRSLTSQLYSVSAYDPTTFLMAGLILLAVAIVACFIPARRASKVHPMVALRHE